ncbi:MAG: HAMP domain-containing protein [Tepidisphaeraceae bacterium]|jgi:signal transduction histidine kinase
MLRHRLLGIIIPLVGFLVLVSIVGIVLLQGTLSQVGQINEGGLSTVEQGNDFLVGLRDARRNLHEMALGHPNQLQPMAASMASAAQLLHVIEQSPIVHHPRFDATLDRINTRFPQVQQQVGALFMPGADVSPAHAESLIGTINEIDGDLATLNQLVREQAHDDFQDLYNRFRNQLIALTIVSILAINLSILSLLRMGAMILRPVDKLVAAARELGKENFDVRVQLNTGDEFGQLAQAYNHMAEELEAAERRRVEVLGQVALSMNHELNNVINIIELQLALVSRRAECRTEFEGPLKQIRQSLDRMTKAVEELRHARRIILTDYTTGVKMLDLHRSAQAFDAGEEAKPVPTAAESHL